LELILANLAEQENAQQAFANHIDLLLSISPARVWKLRMVHKLCSNAGQPCRTALEKKRSWQQLIQTLAGGLCSANNRVQEAAVLTTLPFTKYTEFCTQLCSPEVGFVSQLVRASRSTDSDLKRATDTLLKDLRKDSKLKKHLKKVEKELR
jgi:hypothetical protein